MASLSEKNTINNLVVTLNVDHNEQDNTYVTYL